MKQYLVPVRYFNGGGFAYMYILMAKSKEELEEKISEIEITKLSGEYFIDRSRSFKAYVV